MLCPHVWPISKKVPWSTINDTTRRTSYVRIRLRGMIESSSSSARSIGSFGGRDGGRSETEEGKYDRNRRACSKASFSLRTQLSTLPFRACTCDPPSSFLVRFSNVAYLTTGGPALNSWLLPSIMTLKCDMLALIAANPTTGPSKQQALIRVRSSVEERVEDKTEDAHRHSLELSDESIESCQWRNIGSPDIKVLPRTPSVHRHST